MIELYEYLSTLAKTKFKGIVSGTELIHKKTVGTTKLRIFLKDQSFLDVWIGQKGKYSYHWESRAQRGKIYRHDNAPDHPEIKSFPKHFHDGEELNVKSSKISSKPKTALKQILKFIQKEIEGDK